MLTHDRALQAIAAHSCLADLADFYATLGHRTHYSVKAVKEWLGY